MILAHVSRLLRYHPLSQSWAHLDSLHSERRHLGVGTSPEAVLEREETHAILEGFEVWEQLGLAAHGRLEAAHVVLLESCNDEISEANNDLHTPRYPRRTGRGGLCVCQGEGKSVLADLASPRVERDAEGVLSGALALLVGVLPPD